MPVVRPAPLHSRSYISGFHHGLGLALAAVILACWLVTMGWLLAVAL